MLLSLSVKPSLPLPSLPQAVPQADGSLTIDASHPNIGENLVIRVDRYYPRNKDSLVGYANSVASEPPVTVSEPIEVYYDLKIPFSELPNDNYDVYYIAADELSNSTASLKRKIKLINSPSIKYPAPTYPDAQDSIADFQTIITARGMFVRIAYRSMSITDEVIFTWQGDDTYGNHIMGSTWQKTITITEDDVNREYVTFIIPIDFVSCLGQGGRGVGQYTVNGQESAKGSVILTFENISQVMLHATSGAPLSTSDISLSDARNYVNSFSPPGKEMIASLSGGIFFENKKKEYKFHPDVYGRTDFSVISEADKDVICTVSAVDNSLEPGVIPIIFNSWKDGEQAIIAYTYTTSAIADGKAACMVYAMVDKKDYDIKNLKINVDGNASIIGFYDEERQHATLSVSKSGMVIFSVCNSVSEKNEIEVLAENGNGRVLFSLTFQKFPDF